MNESIADALLEMVGVIRNYLNQIESTEAEGDADSTSLIAKLKTLQKKKVRRKPSPTAN